jgi:hypothetical protein
MATFGSSPHAQVSKHEVSTRLFIPTWTFIKKVLIAGYGSMGLQRSSKMKIMQAEYFEGHGTEKISWKNKIFSTINNLFFDSDHKIYDFV